MGDRITPRTLDGRLRAGGGYGAQAPHHEVPEELVRGGGILGLVVAPVGDAVGPVAALEGAGVRRGRRDILTGSRGREGADGERREGRRPGHAPQADAGSVRESRHGVDW